ncbi:hypothetical protein TBR22_A25110 [Luteitalea sp. TBR-22]|uniref:hypothetical protein n=1 Tax=Luteitalea sp. TBR-22 TaxID=2802971 RepID=UPI001AFBFF96|nr:hypothetical protein [Luteitalea sp. TBR-22]BCS33284.1 hypothetical protein TBR22_A25110 [Luteitalea sp. TBR-22]
MPPRGRPPKFGKPASLVALTLPEDAIAELEAIDPDLGWAIVKLLDLATEGRRGTPADPPDAELLPIGPRQFLIVVRQDVFAGLPHVSLVPLGQGRAFLAFAPGRTIETLELAVLDRLESGLLTPDEAVRYRAFRTVLRDWRRDSTLRFHERSIVVVERNDGGATRRRRA